MTLYYSRVVVMETRVPATKGATFHCASGVRSWRASRSRLNEATAGGVAARGAGNGRGPATEHRKTP